MFWGVSDFTSAQCAVHHCFSSHLNSSFDGVERRRVTRTHPNLAKKIKIYVWCLRSLTVITSLHPPFSFLRVCPKHSTLSKTKNVANHPCHKKISPASPIPSHPLENVPPPILNGSAVFGVEFAFPSNCLWTEPDFCWGGELCIYGREFAVTFRTLFFWSIVWMLLRIFDCWGIIWCSN